MTDDWLDDYHSFRPHESLEMRTPDEKLLDSHISILKKTLGRIDENAENYIVDDARGYKLGSK
jgi:hypothetical protein